MAIVPESDLPGNEVPENDLPTGVVPESDLPGAGPVAPNRFAKEDGTPYKPEDFMDPMTFLERMGRRFVENTEALQNVPTAAKNLATGEGGRGTAALELVGGLLSPLAHITAPLGAATEHGLAGAGASEEWAKYGGNIAEMLSPLPFAKLAQADKLGDAGKAIAAALGVTPGALKATPGVQDFIAEAGQGVRAERGAVSDVLNEIVRRSQGAEFDPTLPRPTTGGMSADDAARLMEPPQSGGLVPESDLVELVDTAGPFDRIRTATPEELVARLLSEQPGQAPVEALPTSVREAMQDPAAMARTSSLLDAAQETVVPRPGNITAGAAMETGQGFLERPFPKSDDFFRTTQESIERVTGRQGNALLKERDQLAEQIQETLLAQKNAAEMQATESMIDAVTPRAVAPQPPSAALAASPVKPMNGKDFERFLLTGDRKALAKVAKAPAVNDLASGVLGIPNDKGVQPGAARMLFEGIFKESTRAVASFGGAGKVLARDMVGALDKGEREAGAAVTVVQRLLKGLSAPDKDSLVDFLDSGAQVSPKVSAVGVQIRAMLNDVASRATGAKMSIKNPVSGDVIPWTPRSDGNYFPHYSNIDFEELFNNPRRLGQAKAELAADHGIDIGEAGRMLDFMMQNAQRRFGNLEMSRVMNWRKWDHDPERVLSRYFSGAYKRLNLAETFNADYKRADDMIEMIGVQSNTSARDMAKTYVDRILGRESIKDDWKAQVSHDVRNFETATKLGQAVIANASQPVLLATVAGLKNTTKALADIMFRNGSEFAGMTGVTLDATMAQIQRELGAGSAGQTVLRRTGFSAVERFNRILSANAGKHAAQDAFARLRSALDSGSTGRANFYREELSKLGVIPAEAIGRGGLSLDELYRAGQAMTKRTQFKTGTADLPIEATSDLGKVLFQFKSFSFKSAQLFKDEIVKEATKGNFAPLTRAALLMPLAGEVINDIQALVNGKTRPEGVVERMADNFAAVGAFGLMYTAFKAIGFGPAAVAGLVMGPSITDVTRLVSNIGGMATGLYDQATNPSSTKDPFKAIGRQAVSAIPTVGPSIANRIWPTAEEQRRQKQK